MRSRTKDNSLALAPYALISRHNPPVTGNYLLHEGAVGVLGADGLQELTYKTLDEMKRVPFTSNRAWLGFTDKYWAAVLAPDAVAPLHTEFASTGFCFLKTYQADYVQKSPTATARSSTPPGISAGESRIYRQDKYRPPGAVDLSSQP